MTPLDALIQALHASTAREQELTETYHRELEATEAATEAAKTAVLDAMGAPKAGTWVALSPTKAVVVQSVELTASHYRPPTWRGQGRAQEAVDGKWRARGVEHFFNDEFVARPAEVQALTAEQMLASTAPTSRPAGPAADTSISSRGSTAPGSGR